MSPPQVSIDALLPAGRFSIQQVAALLMCFLVVAMDGYDTQTLSFVAVDMKQKLGIDPAELGVAFAISQFSGVLGGLAVGPFVDRTGRRPWIIGASFAFGAATLLYPWVSTLPQLLALRFVTGALAAISINVSYTYAAEIAPRSFSARAVVFATIGYAMGVAAGGAISSYLLPRHGWTSVFFAAGCITLVVAAGMTLLLPESVRFLVQRGRSQELVRRGLRRLVPAAVPPPVTVIVGEDAARPGAVSIRAFLSWATLKASLPLWIGVLFLNIDLWLLSQWLPTLVRGLGATPAQSINTITFFTIGGVTGGLVLGTLADKVRRPAIPLAAGLALGIAALLALGGLEKPGVVFLAAVTAAGFAIRGVQFALNGVVAALYPTRVRGAAMALYMSIARVGAVLGPLLAGWMLAGSSQPSLVFKVAAVPALISCLALALLAKPAARTAAQAAPVH